MSIIIKGIEMPRNSHTVTITVTGHGKVYVEYYDCRPHLAETIAYTAIPVPPHGRLIDADALMKESYDSGQYANAEVGFHQMVVDAEDIELAPTIIEAEEEE